MGNGWEEWLRSHTKGNASYSHHAFYGSYAYVWSDWSVDVPYIGIDGVPDASGTGYTVHYTGGGVGTIGATTHIKSVTASKEHGSLTVGLLAWHVIGTYDASW